jgi:hypothetical protein
MIGRQRDCAHAGGQFVVVEQTEMQLVCLPLKISFAQRQTEWCAQNLIAQGTGTPILVGSKGYFPE